MIMKKNILVLIVIWCLGLIGCIFKGENGNNGTKFSGVWEVFHVQYLNDESDPQNNSDSLIGGRVRIDDDKVDILGDKKQAIKYKLKVVNEEYILSYENNLSMKEFIEDRATIDLISIIDKEQIVAELFFDNDNNMILIYKSILFKLKKINDNEINDHQYNNVHITNSDVKNELENYPEGVMIGLKIPREKEEDGTYTVEEYRTIWISYDNGKLGDSYEKKGIIFPRMNGIWKLNIREQVINDNYYDEFVVSIYDEENKEEPNSIIFSENEYKTINFICNDYIAIKKYVGNDFKGEYPIYQILPISNINISNGLYTEEIFNNEQEEKYNSEINKAINRSISNKNNGQLKSSDYYKIDFNNISIGRNSGKWVYISNLITQDNKESEDEIKLAMFPDKRFVKYNSLYIPWKTLKAELGFFKDALISPLGKVAIIQFDNYISIYMIEDGELITEPIGMIPISSKEDLVMAEWSSGSYVEQWEKVFSDGDVIKIE